MTFGRQSRLPRQSTRTRRNADRMRLAGIVGDGLITNALGQMAVGLSAVPGLEFAGGLLQAKVAAPINLSASGIGLSFGTGLQNDGGILKTKDSEIVHDNLSGFIGNEHIDHSAVSISPGTGMTGGGDLTVTRTLGIDRTVTDTWYAAAGSGVTAVTGTAPITSSGGLTPDIALTFGTGLQNDSGTLKTQDSEIVHDNLSGFAANEHIDWTNATDNFVTTGVVTTGNLKVAGDLFLGPWPTQMWWGSPIGTQSIYVEYDGTDLVFNPGVNKVRIFNTLWVSSSTGNSDLESYTTKNTGVAQFGASTNQGNSILMYSFNSTPPGAAIFGIARATNNFILSNNAVLGFGTADNYDFVLGTSNTARLVLTGTGSICLPADNQKLLIGEGSDASVYYDGTNLVCDPKEVGSGILDVLGVLQTDGYNAADGSTGVTQVVTILDGDAITTHTLTFKNGLLTAYSSV